MKFLVGLTGGIGTGKSSLLAAFRRMGAATISADEIAHRLSRKNGPLYRSIKRAFGEKFLRPVVIVRGFGPDACLVIPLTTSAREHALRIPIGLVAGLQARANLSQTRVIDTRRLVEKVGFLEKDVFLTLRKAAKDML